MTFLSANRPIMRALPAASPLYSTRKSRMTAGNAVARIRTTISTTGTEETCVGGPMHAMFDMDQMLLHGQTLKDLQQDLQKGTYRRKPQISVLVKALEVLKRHCDGRTSCHNNELEAQLNQKMQQLGPAAKIFGEWRAWNAQITVPLPRLDGSVDVQSYTMPMASAFNGELVIVKLDVNIDHRIVDRNEQFEAALTAADKAKQEPEVKCFYDDTWKQWIRTKWSVADYDHMYLALHLAHGITDLVDALFMLKLAVEEMNGSPTNVAAAAGAEALQHFYLRLVTRNMRPSFALAAMAAMDPDGRSFGPCQAENLVLCGLTREEVGKGKYVTASNFKHRRQMPAKKGVVVGFDDEIGQMDVHVRSTLAKHATKTLLCDAYQEDLAQHLGKSSGNVAMYLEALGTAAKVIGLPDEIDLWEVIDPRSLQERQTSKLSRHDIITQVLARMEQTGAAAAAAAAATAADQPPCPLDPAASAPLETPAASGDSRGSLMVIDAGTYRTPSRDQQPPRAATEGAAEGEQQQQPQEGTKRSKFPTPSKESAEKQLAAAKAARTAERVPTSSSSSGPVSDLDRDRLATAAATDKRSSAASGGTVKPPAAFAAALHNEFNIDPRRFDTVQAELQELQGAGQQQRQQTSKLFAQYRDPKSARGRLVSGYDTVIDSAYVVFRDSIVEVEAAVRGLSKFETMKELSKMEFVKTSMGLEFPTAWRQQLQQGKLQLIRVDVQFAVTTVWDDIRQKEVKKQFDVGSPLFGRVPVVEWTAEDRGKRQHTLNILLAATVRAVLDGDPRLPAGLYLFSVDDEVHSQSGVTPSVAEKVAVAVDKMGQANMGGMGKAAAIAKHQ